MQIWVGLGNPGEKYSGHRHNIGFMAIDAIGDTHGFGPEKSQHKALCRIGTIGGTKILLMKPSTFMNESGQAVQSASAFYKVPLDKIIVFHDELDLAPGKLRVKCGGGIAGHNGLRSIRQHMGEDFYRIRMGIGHPGHKDRVHSYVLSNFSKTEQPWVEDLNDALARASDHLAATEMDKFQTRVSLLAPAP
ncbi:aminoacyl-tRNA hydrolase [Fretibacter rubidus]|uniref:aminoacyl-tRNA hydrolase n=1 Tax=Fretibacter rubidus TaxID=570162 RepID=UPI00352A1001